MNGVWKIVVIATMVAGTKSAYAGSWQPKDVQIQPLKVEKVEKVETTFAVANAWRASIEYGIVAQSVQIAQQFASGDEDGWSRPVFVTLQHRFAGDDVIPYFGAGVGYAESLVDTSSEVEEDAVAFKGVLGTEMALEEGLGVFFEYGFAVAPKANALSANSIRSHSLNTGLTLDLN